MFFFAFSVPFAIALTTSRAFPRPIPTCPFPSPTTIIALNENLITTKDDIIIANKEAPKEEEAKFGFEDITFEM